MSVIKDKHYVELTGGTGLYHNLNRKNLDNLKRDLNGFFEDQFDSQVSCLDVTLYREHHNPDMAKVSVLLNDQRPKQTAEKANRINGEIADFVQSYFESVNEAEHVRLEGW